MEARKSRPGSKGSSPANTLEYKGYTGVKDSVEDYLDFCQERGEEPEKPFSGNLPLHITPDLHRKIYVAAKSEGKSINHWISETLEEEVG